ncbi:response regulator [Treponema sp.]|uniref:response regulator n=1 Tax=Treponema sp. TaxID=166 RepID=UPI0025E7AF5C|nr:response regulator [Treponema sp.]MCR5218200.1 response regulator [Treponema sp.]
MAIHKVLITGTNKPVINDFFKEGKEYFECITSSLREEDLTAHVRIFAPEVFVCCTNIEHDDELKHIDSLVNILLTKKIPIVVIGTKEGNIRFKSLVHAEPMLISDDKAEPKEFYHKILTLLESPEKDEATIELKHILVIDDDPLMLKMIKEVLHGEFNIASALGGKAGLKFLETKSTDLILLDYEMPELNGIQVLDKIRRNPLTNKIPVVFLTGNRDPIKVKEALSHKPEGYVLKPINNEKLKETIYKILY